MKLKKFKDWGVFTKIFSLVLTAAIPMALLIILYILPTMNTHLMDEKRLAIKSIIEIGYGIISSNETQASLGLVTVEQAQKNAKEQLAAIRYAGEEYFWVNDASYVMIMHPIKPELNGTSMAEYKDPDGKYIFREFADVAQKNRDGGFVNYMWSKQGKTEAVSKIAYVKNFEKWNWVLGSGIYVDDIDDEIAAISRNIYLVLFVLLAGVLVVAYLITSAIVKVLKRLKDAANRLAVGDANISIAASSQDEMGQLENSFNLMLINIKEQSELADKVSYGNLDVEVKVKSENDILSKSLNKVVLTLKNLVEELKQLTNAALNGNLNTRAEVSKYNGGFKEIVSGVNETLDAVIKPVREGSDVLEVMAAGDFTVRVTGDYKGDHQIIKNSINKLGESLSGIISDVSQAIQATASAGNEISSSAEEMAAGAQEQSAQTSEIASAVEQMTKTILETTKNSSAAAEAAKNAGTIAKDGGKIVNETIEGMSRIADVVKKSAETVQVLGKNSDQIGEIVQVINDIADQTNLLALNAAIEAARAGEQGRGFAVVADEVRKLAERTTKATKEIATMIRQIQVDTNEAVVSMQEGTNEVEKGRLLTNKAGRSLEEIIEGAESVVDMSTQLAAASEEQSSAAEQISKNIEGINNVTKESAAGIQQIARAAEDLSHLTVNLQELISKFKVDWNQKSVGAYTYKMTSRKQIN